MCVFFLLPPAIFITTFTNLKYRQNLYNFLSEGILALTWGGGGLRIISVVNWGELEGMGGWRNERVRATIQTLPARTRMRSKGNLCCQLCVFLSGKRREGWAEGVESWTLSTVFCSNSWCLRVKTPHSSFSSTPLVAYCLRTNGRPMQKPIKYLTHLFWSISQSRQACRYPWCFLRGSSMLCDFV